MSDFNESYLECPFCGKNFENQFECNHDEYHLVRRIAELEAKWNDRNALAAREVELRKAVDAGDPLDDYRRVIREQKTALERVRGLQRHRIEKCGLTGVYTAVPDANGNLIKADELAVIIDEVFVKEHV